MEYRIEYDSMGKMNVPTDKYWGAQTQRSIQNFPIGVGLETMPSEIIHAFGYLKKTAAIANHILRPEKRIIYAYWTERKQCSEYSLHIPSGSG